MIALNINGNILAFEQWLALKSQRYSNRILIFLPLCMRNLCNVDRPTHFILDYVGIRNFYFIVYRMNLLIIYMIDICFCILS